MSEDIIVDLGEYKTTRAHYELCSGVVVDASVAIGALYLSRGYMAHKQFFTRNFIRTFEPLFRDLRRVRDKKQLGIWVVGGYLEDFSYNEEERELIREGRKTALDTIIQKGFWECVKEVRWCPPGKIQSLRLILQERRAVIEEQLEDELYGNGDHED